MKISKLFLALGLIFVSLSAIAQVGIGTNTPATSSQLEVSSTTKGFLPPRMTEAQRNAILSPVDGLIIFQTDVTAGLYYFTNSAWKLIISQTDLSLKVDKASGKDLSTNDYTTIEKDKLAAITGSNTGDQINITGNAGTATKLTNSRKINGVEFDGTANITIPAVADAAALTGNTLASTVIGSSLTSLGTLVNLTVTNPIVGSITGQAGTVTRNANLIGPVTSEGNATAIANGAITNAMLANTAVANLTNTNTGDQTASTVVNVAAGTIAATTVQAAINELDTEKAPSASPTFTGTVTLNGQLQVGSTSIADNGKILVLNGSSGNMELVSPPLASQTDAGIVSISDQTFLGNKTFVNTVTSHAFVGDGSGLTGITSSIGDASITSAKILDGEIVNADISSIAAIAQSKIDGLSTSLSAKADLASPTFTGKVTASGTIDLNGASTTLNSIIADDLQNVNGGTLLIQAENTNNMALRIFGNNSNDYYSGGKIVFGDYILGSYGVVISESSDEELNFEATKASFGSSTRQTDVEVNGNLTLKPSFSFVGDGSGLTGVTATATIADESITSAKITNLTLVNADISNSAAIDQSKISGLATSLAGKQNTIIDGGLTIVKTTGLQTALDAKAPLNSPIFTGAVTAGSFIGDGSKLTGIAGGFSTANNVISNSNGTWATDDFVFGSTQLDNDNTKTTDDSRFYFDKSKGAFRAGAVDSDQWNDAGVGNYSVAMGYNSEANAAYSVGLGYNSAANGEGAVALGSYTLASGIGAVAMGATETNSTTTGPISSGRGSVALGVKTTATNTASAALGLKTIASGASSFAFGESSQASGDNSVAGGFGAKAATKESVAIGFKVTANTLGEVVLGSFNAPAAINSNWATTDPLFTIGNGSSSTLTNNAFQILKNGNTTLKGTLTATAFSGNGAALTGITATIADESITSAKITNGTLVDADISASAGIAQSKINGLESSLAGKQSTIVNNGLTIAQTNGLQTTLNAKAPLANPTFTGTVNVSALKWVGGTSTDGKFLISDASGNLLLESMQNASGTTSGIVSTGNQTFAGAKTFTGDVEAKRFILTKSDITAATSTTINLSNGNVFSLSLGTNISTLAFSSVDVGTYIIKFVQDATGGRTVAFPSTWKWSGGTVPTVTAAANKTDIVTLIYDGTTFYAAISQNF